MKSLYNLFDFFLFEGQQLEDYLNDMVKSGFHLQKIGRKIVFEENDKPIYYKVVTLSQKTTHEKLQKLIDFFEESGFEYVDQFQYFVVFSSLENTPTYTDDLFDQDIFLKSSKKEFLKLLVVYGVLILLMSQMIFPITFSKLTNQMFVLNVFCGSLYFLVSLVLSIWFYLSYFIKKKADYHYRLCLLKGYIEKLFLLALVFSNVLLFGTYRLIVGVMTLLVLVGIAFSCYRMSRNKVQPFLFQDLMRVTIGVFVVASITWAFSCTKESTDFSQVPLYQNEMNEIADVYNRRSESIFMDYYCFSRDHYSIEYVDMTGKIFNNYVLDKFLNEGPDYSFYEEKEGYQIYKSEHLIVIYKNQKFIQYNYEIINDTDLVIDKLNW